MSVFNLEELHKYAQQGLSINQVVRKLNIKSDFLLRRFLKNHDELNNIFKTNGYCRRRNKPVITSKEREEYREYRS